MQRFRSPHWPGLWTALWVAALTAACSHRSDVREAGGAHAQQVPFHQQLGDASGEYDDDSIAAKARGSIPFRSSSAFTIPSGTLLTVRLQSTIAGAQASAGQSFTAILDNPVTISGSVILPQGILVGGRLECAHVSQVKPGLALVCLTLTSITTDGKSLPLQTSSLFAKSLVSGGKEIQLPKGHRLTFRLREALVLPGSTTEPPPSPVQTAAR